MYATRGEVRVVDKKIISGLKFKLTETGNEFLEIFLRLYNDNTFSSHYTTKQFDTVQTTIHYGNWEVLEEQTDGTLIKITPTRFEDNPHQNIESKTVLIEGGLKKPKFAVGFNEKKLKYDCRQSKEENGRLPLMFVRDIVTPSPTQPIAAVISGKMRLLEKANCKIPVVRADFSYPVDAYTSGIDCNFFQDQNLGGERLQIGDPLPDVKQIQVAGDHVFILGENGILYSKNGLIEAPNRVPIEYMDIHYIHKYFRHNAQFIITRDGTLYARGSNDNFVLGRRGAKDLSMWTEISLPSNLQALKVKSSVFHSLLLCLDTTTKRSVVLGCGRNENHQIANDGKPSTEFIEIPSKYFNNMYIKDISIGKRFSYFLSSSGVLFACGDNSRGQCAVVGQKVVTTPTRVYDGVKAVECRGKNTLILTEGGRVLVSGYAYGACNCSFMKLNIPEYFRIVSICLGKKYFLFTTDMHEVLVMKDKGKSEIDNQTFVRAHHLAEKQTLLLQHPYLSALSKIYSRSLQYQLKIVTDGSSSVAYFVKPEGKVKNLFTLLWKARCNEKFCDMVVLAE